MSHLEKMAMDPNLIEDGEKEIGSIEESPIGEDSKSLKSYMIKAMHGNNRRDKNTSRRKDRDRDKGKEEDDDEEEEELEETESLYDPGDFAKIDTPLVGIADDDFTPKGREGANDISVRYVKIPFMLVEDLDVKSAAETCAEDLEHHPNKDSAIFKLHAIHYGPTKRSRGGGAGTSESHAIVSDMHDRFEKGLHKLPESSLSDAGVDPDLGISLTDIGERIISAGRRGVHTESVRRDRLLPRVPLRTRLSEEEMMREPIGRERLCIMDDKCEGRFLTTSSNGFTLVEYPDATTLVFYKENGFWPGGVYRKMCVICERRNVTYRWAQSCAHSSMQSHVDVSPSTASSSGMGDADNEPTSSTS